MCIRDSITGLGICLLRIVWIFSIFARFHTLFILCLCYPVSWTLTSIVMFIYYRRRGRRNNVIIDH